MGLRLVAPRSIMQIYKMRRFVLTCNACSIFTAEIGRTSCGNCGNEVNLHKVSVTVIPRPNEKEKNIQTVNHWRNMPLDLLGLIFNKLYYTDRIRFRMVCKDWYRPIGTRIDNELPWIVCHKYSNSLGISEIFLLDPVHRKMYKTLDSRSRHFKLFSNSSIDGMKSGWLILKENNTEGCLKIFLYNPFTGKLFKLPTLVSGLHTELDMVLFSSTMPTSPNCIFVVVHVGLAFRIMHVLGISLCCNGNDEWKTKIFHRGGYEVNSIQCLCTSEDICYIASGDGRLGSICLENQEWNWLVESPCWEMQDVLMNLVEFNGGLLSVKYYLDYGIYEVHRFELKERYWVVENSLGNKALFLDAFGSCVRSTFGETSELADTILRVPLLIYNSQVTVYSMKDEKLSEKIRIYDWIKTYNFSFKIWIEPPYAIR